MIVRTAPSILPEPDAMRAMERLEAQLRRAADDLAATLDAMRVAAEAPLVDMVVPERPGRPRCKRWMTTSLEPCGRTVGHGGGCRSLSVVMDEARRRRVGRRAPREDAGQVQR